MTEGVRQRSRGIAVRKACLLSSLLNGGRPCEQANNWDQVSKKKLNQATQARQSARRIPSGSRPGSQEQGVSGDSGIAGTAKKVQCAVPRRPSI